MVIQDNIKQPGDILLKLEKLSIVIIAYKDQ
jgi:hypothetical protein